MKSIIFFVLSFGISSYALNLETNISNACKKEIIRKKTQNLRKHCAIIQELGLPPAIPCSADRKSEQFIWLIKQKEKYFSPNILT
jgi:hypothetical protein